MSEECDDKPIMIGVRSELEEIAIGCVETLPYAVLVVDMEGHLHLFNREAEFLFGWNRVEVLGQSVEMLLPNGLRESHTKLREGFAGHPRVRQMGAGRKLVARHRTGKEIPVVIYLSPFMSLSKGMMVNAVIRRPDVLKEEAELA